MPTIINKKINHIFLLLERLAKGEELYSQNHVILEELGVNERTMYRYLKEIYEMYGHMIRTEKKVKEFTDRKVTIYRVLDKKKDVSEILKFFIEKSVDLSWLLQLIHENDPKLLNDAQNKELLKESIEQDQNIFLFKNSPFEYLDARQNGLFIKAKSAVKHREYRSIIYCYYKKEVLKNAKCLKLIFMSNNWYLSVEDDGHKLRFLRFCFIKNIDYVSGKNAYRSKILEKYSSFFQTLQNPMTLNKPSKKAHLKASANIAIYFKESMKLFFSSQKFIKENEDGSVEFSLSFTQHIEILPFIKQWQPDLIILSPNSLKNELLQDMRQSIKNYS